MNLFMPDGHKADDFMNLFVPDGHDIELVTNADLSYVFNAVFDLVAHSDEISAAHGATPPLGAEG